MRAELWLWDRPLDELDADALSLVLDVLRGFLEAPSATILVVGDEPLYESFTSTVVRLEAGRLIAEGAT
jgi:ABC-type hemin transport system ATPase subunit